MDIPPCPLLLVFIFKPSLCPCNLALRPHLNPLRLSQPSRDQSANFSSVQFAKDSCLIHFCEAMGNCASSIGFRKKKVQPAEAIEERKSEGSAVGTPRVSVLRGQTEGRIEEKYVLDRELGRGEYGITYLCTDKNTCGKLACKIIPKANLTNPIDIEDVRTEVQIMTHLAKHANIVSLKSTYEDENAIYLVMELCEGGELFDRIVARGRYTEPAAANVMRTVMEVIQVCHKHGVIHRDLKPENFLFANKKENSPMKAIDFGLSVFYEPGDRFSEIVGSAYYMAPEVLKRNYGPEIDVWSAGVILYILLCGVPPFLAESEQGVMQAILRGTVDLERDPWPQISENAKNLVLQMLEPDPNRRITAQQVIEHPWLRKPKTKTSAHTRMKQSLIPMHKTIM